MSKRVKVGGRQAGTPNRLTKAVKDIFHEAFNQLQDHPTANLVTWGTTNPDKFYPLAARLIPAEVNAVVGHVHYVMRTPQLTQTAQQWIEQHPEATIIDQEPVNA